MVRYARGLRPCLALAHRTPTTKAIMNRVLGVARHQHVLALQRLMHADALEAQGSGDELRPLVEGGDCHSEPDRVVQLLPQPAHLAEERAAEADARQIGTEAHANVERRRL